MSLKWITFSRKRQFADRGVRRGCKMEHDEVNHETIIGRLADENVTVEQIYRSRSMPASRRQDEKA